MLQSDYIWFAVSANLIFLINKWYSASQKSLLWQRVANFLCMHSSLLESVIVADLQATEEHFSLDLTKAKYRINTLPPA